MQLRPYQRAATDAALAHLERSEHPALQLATGTGKSLIIAELAALGLARGERVWVLTHVQQLVQQNAETFHRYTGTTPGVVCAGLGRADYAAPVVFATIQSIINPALRGELPAPQLIIIDEAHRIPHRTGEQGQYGRIFERYPLASRVAMTATPWRMDNGIIYGRGPDFWFDSLAYSYTVPQAVADGYLCPLVGVETEVQLNLEEAEVEGGEFVMTSVGDLQTNTWLKAVAESLPELAGARRHIAVYCPTVAAATRALNAIDQHTGWACELITGATDKTQRAEILGRFRSGRARVLVSVDTLTTGFDFPALDCIVCLRPTLSSSLWVQIQGRGTRLAEGKKNCLVLDYAGNLIRLGGVGMYEKHYRQRGLEQVDSVEPRQPYVKRERKVYPGVRTLAVIDPLTGREADADSLIHAQVHAVNCAPIPTRRHPYPVLLVQYTCTTPEGARIDASRFINTERPDSPTLEFFKARALAVNLPSPARSLSWQLKGARQPHTVTVRKSGRYWNVVEETFGDTPE